MTSSHNSKRQPTVHAKSRPIPDHANAGPTNVSNLYAAWLSQREKIDALLETGPAAEDYPSRMQHDAAIGVEVDIQSQIEEGMAETSEATPASAAAKILVAIDQAIQEFGSAPSLAWEMVASALGDLQQIEAA